MSGARGNCTLALIFGQFLLSRLHDPMMCFHICCIAFAIERVSCDPFAKIESPRTPSPRPPAHLHGRFISVEWKLFELASALKLLNSAGLVHPALEAIMSSPPSSLIAV